MVENLPNQASNQSEKFETQAVSSAWFPNLCSPIAVFALVLLAELMAVAITLVKTGLLTFDVAVFGKSSFLILWVVLSASATICAIRQVLNRWSAAKAFSFSYFIFTGYTAVFSVLGLWLFGAWPDNGVETVLANTLLSAIFAGIILRHIYLQAQLNQQQKSEASARLMALQSRIRPHFLFNSLNSIASLIDLNPQKAELAVLNLSRLFRASLSLPGTVQMSDEIDLCKRYIALEKLRLADRLVLHWQVQELPEDARIMNFLLQPLIENAIYHGIQPSSSQGRIDVEIKRVDSDIVIKISNPRVLGSDTKTLPQDSGGAGIALANIRERLDAHYGRNAYLRVVKGEADFNVIVRYPAALK